jgi:hypothetical protein
MLVRNVYKPRKPKRGPFRFIRGPRYRCGGVEKDHASGKRWRALLLPRRGTGEPQALEQDVLIAFLAFAFSQATSGAVTCGFDDGPPRSVASFSAFELFCHPIFRFLGIRGSRTLTVETVVRERLRKHLAARPA